MIRVIALLAPPELGQKGLDVPFELVQSLTTGFSFRRRQRPKLLEISRQQAILAQERCLEVLWSSPSLERQPQPTLHEL